MDKDIRFLVKDIKDATVTAAQEACVQIMNGLVDAGPAFTGEFSSAWYATPNGTGAAGPPRSQGRLYSYDRRNVPKSRFTAGSLYHIVNGAPHAAEAMDLVSGVFESQEDDPVKPSAAWIVGKRYGRRRGQVSAGEGTAISTAPLDWWSNYNLAGNLKKDLALGMQRGFGRARGFKS